MAQDKEQNFANHAMFDPPFHYVLMPLLVILLVNSAYVIYKSPGWGSAVALLATIALILASFKARIYALKVQDRLIRLEERLRLERLLPEAQRGSILKLTEDQLVGLRFAADAELPALVEKALANNWTRKEIKQAVQNWRPDFFRV